MRADEPMAGTFEVEEVLRVVPPGNLVKGMFFSRHAERLGDDFSAVQPRLADPPTRGRYLAFRDYPQHDYIRVYCALAKKEFPRLGLNEGARRIAREDFDVFAHSVLGRVVVALVRDARAALHKLPSVYDNVAPGDWGVSSRELPSGEVRIQFERLFGPWAYTTGQIEGVVLAFGSTPRVCVEDNGDGRVCFDVTLT